MLYHPHQITLTTNETMSYHRNSPAINDWIKSAKADRILKAEQDRKQRASSNLLGVCIGIFLLSRLFGKD